MPGQVEVRDVRWEPETKAMPADGPSAKSRLGPETSDAGCRSDMRARITKPTRMTQLGLSAGYYGGMLDLP